MKSTTKSTTTRSTATRTLILLSAAFALLAAGTCGWSFFSLKLSASNLSIVRTPDPQSPSAQAPDPALAARIARIENGLLPAVVIKGQPPQSMTVADRMAHHKVPGVSVAFFDHGQILWTRAYGLADVASKTGVTPDTLFQAASISKPVTALAALRLVQDGKLTLDEDVNVKLRTWKVPDNVFTAKEKVTIRRILSHSAGLTVHGFPGYASDDPLPTVVQILNGDKPANTDPIRVDVVPGTLWRYSGGGYVVLQTLLSDVTGKPFPQIMSELVLRPAGMTHSTYEQPLPKNRAQEAATPYRANGDPVKGGSHTYPEMAPAGLWTTPSDLARVAIEVQAEYAGKSSKILSQDIARQMLTRQIGTWGLGFGLESPGRQTNVWPRRRQRRLPLQPRDLHRLRPRPRRHDQLRQRRRTNPGNLPLRRQGIRLARLPSHRAHPDQSQSRHHLRRLSRHLRNPQRRQTSHIDETHRSLRTSRAHFGPDPQELLPESPTQFFVLSGDITFTFQKDTEGTVTGLTLQAGSQTFAAKKI